MVEPTGWEGAIVDKHERGTCACVSRRVDGIVIKSLPESECDWEGHARAVDEAGFCPVCQH